jgi:Haem-binding domain
MTSRLIEPLYFACMRNKIIRKKAKLTPILLVSTFIGMQFVPIPGVSKTSTTGSHTAEMTNPRVGKILDRACQDCHSNRTAWPWYSRVAPVSWVVSKHVNEGREILNFSEWAAQPPSDGERLLICDAVSDGRMPLSEYTAIHRDARLSKRDVEVICEWAAAPSTSMTSMHVDKLTNNNK